MITTSEGGTPIHCAAISTVCATLCVEQCRCTLPFCQYAIAERVSSGMCPDDWVMKVSSRTSAASLNPASRSPYCQLSPASPSGSIPSGAAAKSSAVHLMVFTSWPT